MLESYLVLLTVAGLGVPAAPVRYDPEARTGFVEGRAVQRAFGWDRRELTANAPGVEFQQDFWTDDVYAATCGGSRTYRVVHHREFGRFELVDVLTGRRYGTPGFRITGARAGISGTSAAPVAGAPCPDRAGARITRLRLTATTSGWALSATSGDDNRELERGPRGRMTR